MKPPPALFNKAAMPWAFSFVRPPARNHAETQLLTGHFRRAAEYTRGRPTNILCSGVDHRVRCQLGGTESFRLTSREKSYLLLLSFESACAGSKTSRKAVRSSSFLGNRVARQRQPRPSLRSERATHTGTWRHGWPSVGGCNGYHRWHVPEP